MECPFCQKVCKNEGGLRLHVYNKHPEHFAEWHAGQAGQATVTQTTQVYEAEGRPVKCPECGNKLTRLNPFDREHNYFIQQGYRRYCTKCQEVTK